MGLETATYISDLVATNPQSNDPKSEGDDHLRLIKSTLKTTFPNVAGAVTPTHTEINGFAAAIAARGLIAGQTWTGSHTFPATVYGVTASPGASGTALATLDFVNAAASSAALPGQTGNSGKRLVTNGTTASWTDTHTIADNQAKGADIASAGTINLTTATGNLVHVTGTTTITAITIPVGAERTVIFDGALTLTHGAALLLPGAANIVTAVGDRMTVRGDTAGAICVSYTRADGNAVSGGMVLLATMTPTAAANLDFLTTFGASYDNYLILGTGVLPATSDILTMRFANAGTVDTGTNYAPLVLDTTNQTTTSSSISTSFTTLQSGKGMNFSLLIENANDTTNGKTCTGTVLSQVGAPSWSHRSINCFYFNAAAVSGFRFYWSGGANFTATGKIRVYGYRNS